MPCDSDAWRQNRRGERGEGKKRGQRRRGASESERQSETHLLPLFLIKSTTGAEETQGNQRAGSKAGCQLACPP